MKIDLRFRASGVFFATCLIGFAVAGSAAEPPVDRYGQYTLEDWPNKVKSDDQLRQDAKREGEALKDIAHDPVRFDRYGGVRSRLKLKATGFFRTQEVDGRWWLVTPEGNLFYLKGMSGVPYLDYGLFTDIYPADGKSLRTAFTEGLPAREEFPEAYSADGKAVSFLAANIRRKYGSEPRAAWSDITEKRLRKWGFNASAKWNNPFIYDRFPFIVDSDIGEVRRIGHFVDPFDPDFAQAVANRIAPLAALYRNNPMVLGYSFENENGWSYAVPGLALWDSSGDLGAKAEFLRFLEERHGDAGRVFGTPGASREELMKRPLLLSAVSPADTDAFILQASRRYHSVLAEELRKQDPNHLLFGASHFPAQDIRWIEGSIAYVDVIPLHEYDLGSDWISRYLAPSLRRWNKPYAVMEYSFLNNRRGLGYFSSRNVMKTEADRGRAFQLYTERLAADPLCIGTSWFLLHDQPVTRRNFADGEAFNFGMVNVCDQPYEEMLPYVEEANRRLFAIHAGLRSPGAALPMPESEELLGKFIPESLGNLKTDSSNQPFFHDRKVRLQLLENRSPGVPQVVGTVDAGQGRAFQQLEFYVFLWKKAPNQKLDDWFKLEESSDNVHFTPVNARFSLVRANEFNEHLMVPEKWKDDTRFVRFSMVLNDNSAPWATALADLKVTHQPRK